MALAITLVSFMYSIIDFRFSPFLEDLKEEGKNLTLMIQAEYVSSQTPFAQF